MAKRKRNKKISPDEFDRLCSRTLAKAVSKKYKYNITKAKLSKWPQYFRLMREQERFKRSRIKTVLLWYCQNIGKSKFIPDVQSATSFREKFMKIEKSMKRKIQDDDEQEPTAVYRMGGDGEMGWYMDDDYNYEYDKDDDDEVDYEAEFDRDLQQTNKPKKKNKRPKFRPVVIEKAQMDELLKVDSPLNAIGLYAFYYYMGNVQETNQPYVTDSYAAEKLKCHKSTIAKYREMISDTSLIRRITKKLKKGFQNYIKLKKYRRFQEIEELQAERDKWKRRAYKMRRLNEKLAI